MKYSNKLRFKKFQPHMFADRKCSVTTAALADDRGMMPSFRNLKHRIHYFVIVVLHMI